MAGDTEQLVVALEARIRDLERNFQRASRTADTQFNRIERRATQSAERLQSTLRSSTANINRLLGTIGAGVGLNELRQLAESWSDLSSRVNVAVGSQEKGAAVMARLSTIARRTYSDIGNTTEAFIANNQALKDLGYSTQTQLDYTEALNNALVVSGAKGQRAESVTNALAKAMALGQLRGENLNTVISTGGRVAQALADGLGVTVNELRRMGAQGKLTGDVIVKALTGQLGKLREEADSMPATITDAMVILKNAMTEYVGKVDEANGITAAFADGIIGVADNIDSVAKGAAAAAAVLLAQYVPALARATIAQVAAVATNPWLLLATAIGGAIFALAAFGDEIRPVQGELANLHDYAGAAWDMIRDGASDAAATVRDVFVSAVNLIADALGGAEISVADLADFAEQVANTIMNAFVLVYDTIVITFTKLPQAIAEAVLNAVNALIAGVESGLNTVIAGVNAAVEAINGAGEHVGVTLGTIEDVQLGRIANGYAGAGEAAGNAYLDALRKVTRDRVGEVLGNMRERANERARQREAERQIGDDGSFIDTRDDPRIPTPDAAERNAFEKEIARVQKRIAMLQAETEARRNATGTYEEQQRVIEKARRVQELLNAAQEAGVEITDDVRSKINSLADAYSLAAEEARKLAKSQQEAAQRSQELEDASKDAFKGFIKDLIAAKSPAEALLNALQRLSEKLLDMAMDALWESIFGASRGNNIFSTWARAFAPSASPVKSISLPASTTATVAEQTFAAPLGTVERAALPPVTTPELGLRGTLGIDGASIAKTVQPAIADAVQPAMQDAATSFAKSITLTPQEITDLKKTLMTEWVPGQGDMQGKGIIDTILNRKASGRWGNSIADVVNARKQFSDVNGPPAWKHGRTSVDQLSVNDPRFGRASRLVDEYLPQRAAGTPSSVGDHLNYANRAYSTPNNFAWIDRLQGPRFGGHKHGTTADLERFRPGDFGVQLPKETVPPGLDMNTTGSIAAQQAQEAAQKAVQEQIEAQKRLAEQMAATQQATQSMQMPIQNLGTAATQVVPNLGGLGQNLSSLMGPLAQAPAATGAFSDALMQMIQQMMTQKGMGMLGGFLGFADGGHVDTSEYRAVIGAGVSGWVRRAAVCRS